MSFRRFVIKADKKVDNEITNLLAEIEKKFNEKIKSDYGGWDWRNNTLYWNLKGSSDALSNLTEIIKEKDFFIKEEFVVGL